MSVFQKFWRKEEKSSYDDCLGKVDELEGEQLCNPFTELYVLQHHTDIVRHLLLIDDRKCVSAGDDGLIVIWDVQLCMKLMVLEGHTRPVTCMLIFAVRSNESDWLLTSSSDKHIKVWDVDQGKCLQDIVQHDTSVKCLLLVPESTFLSAGETIHLWSNEGKLLYTYHSENREQDDVTLMIMTSTRNKRFVTASDKQLRAFCVRELEDNGKTIIKIVLLKNLPPHREAIGSLVFVSDILFASGSLDGTILLWSSETFLPVRNLNALTEYKGKSHVYPYSIQYLTCENQRYIIAAIGCGFAIFDAISKKLLCKKLNAHFSKVTQLTFSCNGAFLATCSEDGSIRLWGQKPSSVSSIDDRLPSKAVMGYSAIERFLDMSADQLKSYVDKDILPEPVLLGECLGHGSSIQKIVENGEDGLVSCGGDHLVIAWKNSGLQRMKRNEIIQKQVLNPSGIV